MIESLYIILIKSLILNSINATIFCNKRIVTVTIFRSAIRIMNLIQELDNRQGLIYSGLEILKKENLYYTIKF
jgi:hypothetical protein